MAEIALPESVVIVPGMPGKSSVAAALHHWPEYAMEAAGVGILVTAACIAGAILEHPHSPVVQAIPSAFARRVLMGMVMGLIAAAIIYSPWGKQSGAHLNPSVSLTFFRLGKVKSHDLFFYVIAQLAGAAIAVITVAGAFGIVVAHPAVRYLVSVPEHGRFAEALAVEFVAGLATMGAVLIFSNSPRLEPYPGIVVGGLAALYFALEAPFFKVAPANPHQLWSLLLADLKSSIWIYFTAPPLRMLAAAEIYLWRRGKVNCAKLNHCPDKRCIFCGFTSKQEIQTAT
jgi:aquaporin Z